MKNSISFLTFFLGSILIFAQNIHSPAEIFKILTDSKLTYEIGIMDEKVPKPDYSELLNYNDYYRVEENGQIFSKKYELGEPAGEYFQKAEEFFQAKRYEKAEEMYLKVLEEAPNFYKVMTYMGQINRIKGDNDEAVRWFKKTIDNNYIDYMSHWFLATTYSEMGNSEKAIEEITIARILNRNNPRIKDSYEEIYSNGKLKTLDWNFTPQMVLDSVSPTEVSIQVGDNWMGYALVKAVWRFEPGYKESMNSNSTASTLEEREAILGLISSFNKKVLKKNPEFKALNLALESDFVNEYIIYEIILPQYPFVAYQLPEDYIKEIAKYIIQVRGNQK